MATHSEHSADTYTRYGVAVHRGCRYVVTSSPAGQPSTYDLRAWKSTPGRDLVVSVRDPAAPVADWHPEYAKKPKEEQAELLASVVQVFLKWEAGQ